MGPDDPPDIYPFNWLDQVRTAWAPPNLPLFEGLSAPMNAPSATSAPALAPAPWLQPPHDIQRVAGTFASNPHPASPGDTAPGLWTSSWSMAPGVPAAAGPYAGAPAANPYLGFSADELDPHTRRQLEEAQRAADFVKWMFGGPSVRPAQSMQYAAADAPRPSTPTAGTDDAVGRPAPFKRMPASSPPRLPSPAAPQTQQGTFWSMLSPSGELLPARDVGAANSPFATPTWPRVPNSHVPELAGHPVYPPSPAAAPAAPSPPIAALEDAGLPQSTALPLAPPPPIADDRSRAPNAWPAWSAPPRSTYWQAQHGIDTGPPTPTQAERDAALARTANTRRLASEGWEAGYGDQPLIPYEWRQTYNSTTPAANTLWNAGTLAPWTVDKLARTARGAYLGTIGGVAGALGDAGLERDPDALARALPEGINVLGAATAQPELASLPRFPATAAARFAAKYPGEAVAGTLEPYLFNRPMNWAMENVAPEGVGALGGRLVPPRPAAEADLIRSWLGIPPERFKGEVRLDPPFLSGDLLNEHGVPVGQIDRSIDPERKTASHGLFWLRPEDRGTGLSKDLMRSNIDFYRRNGISSIDVNAGLDVGGYAWAKYGFVPTQASWDELRASLLDRLRSPEAADIPFKAKARAAAFLQHGNPDAIWPLSDMKEMTPFVDQAGEPLSLSKWLLLQAKWTGKMDLNDAQTMARFDAYVRRSR